MYLSLGPTALLPYGEIVGIFDLDNVSQSHRTRAFLKRAEQAGEVTAVGEDIPKSLVVSAAAGGRQRLYLAQPAPSTLRGRVEGNTLLTGRL